MKESKPETLNFMEYFFKKMKSPIFMVEIKMKSTSLKILSVLIMLLPCLIVFPQVNKTGVPFFKNFSPKEYRAHSSNWAVVQDKRGFIYVGNNNNGVLEYDGNSWRQIRVPNNSIVRSLAVDSNGIVYIGAVGEFGYLEPDKTGKLNYTSISSHLDSADYKFSSIWKTYANGKNEIIFCALQYIFIYKHKQDLEIIKLPKNCFFSFYINNELYITNYDEGLLMLNNNREVEKAKGGGFFVNKDILKILPYKKDVLLIYTYDGLFLYNTETGLSEPPVSNSHLEKTSNFLKDNLAYNATKIDDHLFAWATINAGIAVAEKKGKLIQNFTDSTGLQDKQVSDLYYCNDQGILWATFLNGISKFEYKSPLKYLGSDSKLAGTISDIIRFEGKLYVGTSLGLYYLDYKKSGFPVFKTFDELKSHSVNALKIINIEGREHLLVGTSFGACEVFEGRIKNYVKSDIYAYCIYPSKFYENTFYLGTERGLRTAKYVNGTITLLPQNEIVSEIRSITEDDEGNLWMGSLLNGVFKMSKDGKVKTYTTADGLPVINDIYILNTNSGLLFGTAKGLCKFNYEEERFEEDNQLGKFLNEKKLNIISIFHGFNNQIWMNINNGVYKFIKHYSEYITDSVPFKRIPPMSIQVIYTEPDGSTWIGGSEGLFHFDNFFKRKYNIPYKTLIRSVSISSNDSVLFHGTYYNYLTQYDSLRIPSVIQPDELKPLLSYRFNNLTFNFASPYFEDEQNIKYSYSLEGFDENWSKWSHDNKAVYTNLTEGRYIFKVKSVNIYGSESSIAQYEFEILPPWYRTVWAYSGYAIIGILILIFSVKIYTRKLEADKKRLEGIVVERTAEVVRQKDEILIKNKEIEHKNKDITDSIRYAQRIQEALLPTEQSFCIPSVEFFIYFRPKDIVSGDFYFLRRIESSHLLVAAAADCTGHGVPGAFMSMLGMSFLNEIIIRPDVTHSDQVLNHLRESIIESLNQSGREGETKDGMDISLIAYEYNEHKLEFSGANNPLYLIRNNELIEYKGDKMPIGLHDKADVPFSREIIDVQKDDIIYLFSDGFADQFGGDKGRKYMYKKFKEFLLLIHGNPLKEQRNLIEKEISGWRGEIEQIDDHIVMGIKFIS